MANANKNKGKSFERELAAHLSTVFGLNFERVWSSGAFTGGKNYFRKASLSKSQELATSGDIIVPDELSLISFEAKFYKVFSFVSLFSTNKQLDGWIAQAQSSRKMWFLPFKVNNCGVHVVYDPAYDSVQLQTVGNFMRYGKYNIVPLVGFFEANKDILLNYCKKSDRVSDEATTIAVQAN